MSKLPVWDGIKGALLGWSALDEGSRRTGRRARGKKLEFEALTELPEELDPEEVRERF